MALCNKVITLNLSDLSWTDLLFGVVSLLLALAAALVAVGNSVRR